MPIFEYACESPECGKRREVIERYYEGAAEPQTCTCGQRMRRAVSASSFHLKGSAWAKDNYGGAS